MNNGPISAAHGDSSQITSNYRLYTSETTSPASVPSTDAFNFDAPLLGTPPTFVSPMYTNLFANTPRDAMTYAEKPFPPDSPAFPFRTQILKYLQEYGEEIRHLVKFNTEVLNVEKQGKWCLTIRDLLYTTKKPWIEKFDAVAVASGTPSELIVDFRALRYSVDP